ncbi:MAG: selenocysteine-specific translation elongation factor [Pseudomonadota bacterium]|nr:selenocysteine-specific translation elongation factor [Pseudomonadota bacterium]
MIITLAGHVDHGKTTIVRALTGVDTDRLAEEKARGLTIDLGFAYTEHLGFVDVPGHQKFIHNMVAGIAADQHALLVIAADDGPMPQTREHLEILSLIGIRQGSIALTKCDLVSPDRLSACYSEIRQLTEQTFLQVAPIFQTSVQDTSSYTALGEHLRQQAAIHQRTQDDTRFRLAIDRAFTVKGAGLVVTGTVHSGTIQEGQQVYHFPSEKALRVRSLRVEDQPAVQSSAGDRCALNLVGASLEELGRGDWITEQPTQGANAITIKLDRASSLRRPLKHWMPVHAYHATRHSTARLALFTAAQGQQTWAEVICDTPMACHRGDRLVLRDQALDATLGGGEVLFVSATQVNRRNTVEHRELVAAYAARDAAESFRTLMLQLRLNMNFFQQVWNLTDSAQASLLEGHETEIFDDLVLSKAQWQATLDQCRETVEAACSPTAQNDRGGLTVGDLDAVAKPLRQPALDALLKTGEITKRGAIYFIPRAEPTLSAELLETWKQVEPLLDQLQAPSCGDMAKKLNRPLAKLERSLLELAKSGLLIPLGNHRFYLPRRLQEIADVVQAMTEQTAQGTMTVKDFRDRTGIGRNVAIDVLEFFDKKGFTRRQGNERIVIRPFSP